VKQMNTNNEDVRPQNNKRRKRKFCLPIDEGNSDDASEQSATAVVESSTMTRCLRSHDSVASERVKKEHGLSEADDDDKDADFKPDAVSRPKRTKRRRH